MRFLTIVLIAALNCQVAMGQATSTELIAKFRKTIGADQPFGSTAYLIEYRGVRYQYALRDGKLQGDSFDFNGKLVGFADSHNKHRKEMEMRIGIVPFKITEVINGQSGWYQLNEGDAVAMGKAEVDAREQREIQIEGFLGRESFDPKFWQFSEPKSSQVRGRDAWMIVAKTNNLEPISLQFDKQSGLLHRLTSKTTDFAWLPGEKPKVESFVRDLFFSGWKKFGKRMLPGRLEAYHDGVLWQQMEPVNVGALESVDSKLFDFPRNKK